jgi:hypothetical protein
MTIEAPSRDGNQLPDDEQQKPTVVSHKPKATVQWPPDCLWPFMYRGQENRSLSQSRTIPILTSGRNQPRSTCT